MTDLTVYVGKELAKHDFLDRPLSSDELIYNIGDFLYRPADAAEFLQFLHYLCQHQNSAPAILHLLGAQQITANK